MTPERRREIIGGYHLLLVGAFAPGASITVNGRHWMASDRSSAARVDVSEHLSRGGSAVNLDITLTLHCERCSSAAELTLCQITASPSQWAEYIRAGQKADSCPLCLAPLARPGSVPRALRSQRVRDRVPLDTLARRGRVSADCILLAERGLRGLSIELVERLLGPVVGPRTCPKCQGATRQINGDSGFIVVCPRGCE